jgi:hypothetical protein
MRSKRIKLACLCGTALGTISAFGMSTPAMAQTAQVGPVSITMGGFLAMETIFRTNAEGADMASTFSGMPFRNSAVGQTQELRFSARQSRVAVLAKADVDPMTHLAFYVETDFLGGAQTANSNESNSFNLRMRNLYGTVDWDDLGLQVLAGQSWSLVTMNGKGITPRNEDVVPTIDAQYIVGFTWTRQPQIRIVKNWDKQFWLALSVENPQTVLQSAPTGDGGTASGISITDIVAGGSGFDKANNLSLNHIPDLVAKAAYEPIINGAQPLHIEVYGLYRDYYDRVNIAGINGLSLPAGISNVDTSGGGFGAGITWNAIPKILDLQVSGMIGNGIGRYGSGQLPDVAINPNGQLQPIPEQIGLIGATLHLGTQVDFYGYAGEEEENRVSYDVAGGHFGSGDPNYTVSGCFTEGGSCTINPHTLQQLVFGTWYRFYQGNFGRAQFGVQYSYTQLKAFTGVGGTPRTDDNMVFTSFRWYPAF